MVQDFTEHQLISLQKRTVKVLSLGQALGGFGLGATLSVGALLAVELSGTTAWSGAAATLSTLGSAAIAIPLANLAFKRGRRVSLAFGAFLAILGATMMILATYTQSFPVEIVALLFLGAGSAVSLQARFAAADIPTGKPKGRDLSLVVWATTLGAVIGPNLIAPGETLGLWLGMPHLAGPFLFTIAAQLSSTLVFWFGLRPDPLIVARDIAGIDPKQKNASIKDALEVVREFPLAGYAVLTIALSHMVMVSVMSMTPAHLNADGHSLADVGFTISLHVAGMYSLAPVFGWLTDKFGAIKIVIIGQFISLTSLAVSGFWQSEFYAVVLGLFLLGVGWSASTVAASALLSETLATGQRSKVQGFSDSLMNLSGAFGGAISGIILTTFTFGGLNAAALVPLVFITLATSYSKRWR
jgi:MFS family permease